MTAGEPITRLIKYIFYFIGDGMASPQIHALVESKAAANRFVFANTRAEFDALDKDSSRAIAVNAYLDGSNAIPYAWNCMAADGPGEDYEGSITLR